MRRWGGKSVGDVMWFLFMKETPYSAKVILSPTLWSFLLYTFSGFCLLFNSFSSSPPPSSLSHIPISLPFFESLSPSLFSLSLFFKTYLSYFTWHIFRRKKSQCVYLYCIRRRYLFPTDEKRQSFCVKFLRKFMTQKVLTKCIDSKISKKSYFLALNAYLNF